MKAKEFFYLRHGQTDANSQHLLCGRWDIPLNSTGIAQAEAAAELIHQRVAELGTICTSPLVRAHQTAEHVSRHFFCGLTVMDEWMEWDMGEWEQKSYHALKDSFHSEINPEGGETRAVFNDRIARALERSLNLKAPILIVAHGEVWRAVRRVLEIADYNMPNGIPHRVYQVQDDSTGAYSWKVEKL